jgi:hypothetical protein
VAAASLLFLAGGCLVAGGTMAVMLAPALAVLALALWRRDAREAWHLACNRCRERERRRLRAARPKLLSRSTEIHV